jgi:glycosyltransferase involved in cell wall biosynthesis
LAGDTALSSDAVLMAEWFGRGGIAHTAESWARELDELGIPTTVVTRAGRELSAIPGAVGVASRAGALGSHLAAVRRVAMLIRSGTFSHVVLHGSVVPQVEAWILRVARTAGARSVLVAHEPALARGLPGGEHALAALVRKADVVVAHSRFVASALEVRSGRRDFLLLPLPLPLGLVDRSGRPVRAGRSVLKPSDLPTALHFGHLHRGYKGTDTILDLAAAAGGVPGWRLAAVGKGAPSPVPGLVSVTRFLEADELTATVAGSGATLLPYRRASQSAAVLLAQALGSVVLASAVGAIPEQVEDGVSGILLPAGSPAGRWRDALVGLTDAGSREALAGAAHDRVVAAHREFASGIAALLA